MNGTRKWEPVVFAGFLPPCADCGEPWCPKHRAHFADCPCIGPTEDDVEYKRGKGGTLMGRRIGDGADS